MECFVCKKDISDRAKKGHSPIFCEEHENRPPPMTGIAINDAVARSDFHKREIAKGVKGRDLIQPFTSDGKFNKDFFHHYGDKQFKTERDQERVKRELG